MYRNIFSVYTGVLVSIVGIIFSIRLIKKCFIETQYIPISKLGYLFIEAPNKFFLILIFCYAISTLLGGFTTAFFAKNAKKAYSILTGLILFFIALFHIFFYTFPIWFKIIILPVFFPFSYLGGNFIEFLQKKKWID